MAASNYEPTVAEKTFLEYHDRLRKEIQEAGFHFRLWKRLENYKADYIKELKQAPVFFSLTIRSHFETTLWHIFRVIDKDPRSLHIGKFLNFVRSNLQIFSKEAFSRRMVGSTYYDEQVQSHVAITPEIVQADKGKLEALEPTINNLRIWRDKVFAHIDIEFMLSNVDVAKQYRIEVGQIEDTVNTFFEILNTYRYAYTPERYEERFLGEDDVQTVMNAIRFRIQEWEKQYNRSKETK